MGFISLLALALISASTVSSAAVDQRWTDCEYNPALRPCTCDKILKAIRCETIEEIWSIKDTFDNFSDNTDNSYVYNLLIISGNKGLREISENAFSKVLFKNLIITENPSLIYVSPFAFGATANVTEELTFHDDTHIYQGDSFWDVVKALKVAHTVEIETPMQTISSHMFQSLPLLKVLHIIPNLSGFKQINEFAFKGLSNLTELAIHGDIDVPEVIQPFAFFGLDSLEVLDFGPFGLLRKAEEVVFKEIFDTVKKVHARIVVCDETNQMEWICAGKQVYEPKLIGFYCDWDNETNIWDYCATRQSK